MDAWSSRCPGAVHGRHDEDRDGRCHWCRRKMGPAQPRPDPEPVQSDLILAYRYYFDPDFGANRADVY